MTLDHFKQTAKRFARPALRPLLFRLNRPMSLLEPQIANLNQQIANLNQQIAAIQVQQSQLQQEGGRRQRTIDDLARVWLRMRNDMSNLEGRLQDAPSVVSDELHRKFDPRVAQLEGEVRALQAQFVAPGDAVDDLRRDFDRRSAQADNTLRFLLDRVEFVRRELMFEMSYGAGRSAKSSGAITDVASSILNRDKLELAKAQGNMKVNLGCGHIPMQDYINVDARDVPGVDVVADVGTLPFEVGTLDEVFSSHLVEHFPQEELKRRLLPHWRSMLKPGGVLRAVVPDGEAMLKGVSEGTYGFDDFREVLFGSQDYNGDFHFNLLTPDSLTKLVQDAGFGSVEIPVRGRRNGQCFEFELFAIR